MPTSRTRRIALAAAGIAGLTGLTAGVALAASGFGDVPEGHPFEDEISAVAGAGVAGGFADGDYRPADDVTRQAMAAFLGRGLGRVGSSEGFITLDTNGEMETVASVTIDAGGIAGNGFVVVQVNGDVTYNPGGDPALCPCTVNTRIVDSDNTVLGGSYFELQGLDGSGDMFGPTVGYSDHAVVPIAGGTSETYRLTATMHDLNQDNLVINGIISATYVPFGPDGDNTLTYAD